MNSARDHGYKDIEDRIREEKAYVEALATVLFGRYKIQKDCSARMAQLLDGQSYIYPQKPGGEDLETGGRKPFEHPGIPATAGHFFQGPHAIAEKLSNMFKTNPNGKKECPKPQVALSGAAVRSAISDWASGEYKHTSFNGGRAQEVYNVLIVILETVEQREPAKYHRLMEEIRGTALGEGSMSAIEKRALEMLDI
ncbi:hypothetical protein B0H14DRAFT_3461552 [Mycena olivaceomarginata]|nr:hypothetical protein B0H14DRAFT_3461552 [Mycena olivaceomarginata]